MPVLVATDRAVVVIDVERGTSESAQGISDRPTCLAADALVHGWAWCGTHRNGVFRSDDGGRSWRSVGLAGRLIMAIAASPVERDVVWVGTEPSAVWRSSDAGATWEQTSRLETLPSSPTWSFPPKPDTHHVRWIACHPLSLNDSGWRSRRVRSCPRSTAAGPGATASLEDRGTPTSSPSIAVHPMRCASPRATDTSRATTQARRGARPSAGLDVGYLRSVAIDPGQPDVVVVSASSGPHTAYVAGRSDGRLYRRRTGERWERVRDGWPEPPSTIAPLLCAGATPGEMWAADERGVHRSDDSGSSWRRVAGYATSPQHLRGLALLR